ncbi:MAG: hypothetical protein JRM78_00765 [Nitrososphaerota archaeon]|nr:hypothetical protein [Nitrososphaerota archaeon]
MNKIRIFSVSAVIMALLILSAAYATTSTTATISINSGSPVGAVAWTNENPSWKPATNAGGSITAGNLYNVTVPGSTTSLVTIYLTNPANLSVDYEFLNMNISYGHGVSSVFTPIPQSEGTFNGTILSLSNGYVQFEITNSQSGPAIYTIGIAGGSFYCLTTTGPSGSLNPSFYITVEAV